MKWIIGYWPVLRARPHMPEGAPAQALGDRFQGVDEWSQVRARPAGHARQPEPKGGVGRKGDRVDLERGELGVCLRGPLYLGGVPVADWLLVAVLIKVSDTARRPPPMPIEDVSAAETEFVRR